MEWLEHTDKIVILLGVLGGGVVWIWTQFRSHEKEKNQRSEDISEREASYLTRLESRNEQLVMENGNLYKQVLQARLDQVASGHPPSDVLRVIIEACPKLMWAKRRISENEYVYLAVSYTYASLYLGGPPKAFVGKDPANYAPKEVYDDFVKMDEICFRTQSPVLIHGKIYGTPTKAEGIIEGCKFCVRLSDGYDYVIGIADHLTDDSK